MRKARRWTPPEWSDGEFLSHVLTIADWRLPAIRLADAQSAVGGQVWMHCNDWRFCDRCGGGLGSPRGLDLGLLGDLKPDLDAQLASVKGRQESYRAMVALLRRKLAHVIHGNGPGGDWPTHDLDRRETFLFDGRNAAVSEDPDCRSEKAGAPRTSNRERSGPVAHQGWG
jgi:hypothetical protein